MLGVILLLVACRGEQTPVEIVRDFLGAIENLDATAAASLVCPAQRDKVRGSLAPFDAIAAPGEAFDISFGKLVIQEQSNDGQVSIVRVKGYLTIFFLGDQELQEVDETHTLVKNGGNWLICNP